MVQKTLNNYEDTLGDRAFYVLSAIVLIILMLSSVPVHADDENVFLEKSGILYPGGFDMNTLGEVRGRVNVITVPQTGPVYFDLTAEKDTYIVLVSPVWFWRQSKPGMAAGDTVTVKGSKSLGRDSNLYIIAQNIIIEATGQIITLRNKEGKPVWSNASRMSGSGNRGNAMRHGAGKTSVSGGQKTHGK
jgi:hypothetical protein